MTPDAAVLDEIANNCACFNLRRAARAITQVYDRTLAPSGLRATQLSLLVALTKTGGIPFTRLAAVMGMDRTTLTRNVTPLQRDGLVTRRPGPDRRVKLLTITAKGSRTLAAAVPLWEEAQVRIISGIGAGRWANVRRELRQITLEGARQ